MVEILVKIGCFGDVLRLHKKYFLPRHGSSRGAASSSRVGVARYVMVFSVHADGVFDKDGV